MNLGRKAMNSKASNLKNTMTSMTSCIDLWWVYMTKRENYRKLISLDSLLTISHISFDLTLPTWRSGPQLLSRSFGIGACLPRQKIPRISGLSAWCRRAWQRFAASRGSFRSLLRSWTQTVHRIDSQTMQWKNAKMMDKMIVYNSDDRITVILTYHLFQLIEHHHVQRLTKAVLDFNFMHFRSWQPIEASHEVFLVDASLGSWKMDPWNGLVNGTNISFLCVEHQTQLG